MKRSYLYKKCKNWSQGYPDNYLYNNECGFWGGVSQAALVSCVSPSLIYHGIMVVMIENLATDRSQAMTCILTWNSTCRRCEMTGLLWFCWSIHARCETFVQCWYSFLHLKQKQLFIDVGAEPISRYFVTQHSSTRPSPLLSQKPRSAMARNKCLVLWYAICLKMHFKACITDSSKGI